MNSIVAGLKFHDLAKKTGKMQFYSDTFKPFNSGCNLVGDREDVALTFSGWGYVICHVLSTFFSLGFVFGEVLKIKMMFVTFCVKSFSCFMVGCT